MSSQSNEIQVLNTVCRDCFDEARAVGYSDGHLPRADFIIWGKFFPPEALGPRCTNHAIQHFDTSKADQYAVLDLREARAQAAAGVYRDE